MKREDKQLTLRAAADRLGLHEQTVRRYIRKGLLRAFKTPSVSKFGGRIRIHSRDLEKFRARHLTTHESIAAPAIEPAGAKVGNGVQEDLDRVSDADDFAAKNSLDETPEENLF